MPTTRRPARVQRPGCRYADNIAIAGQNAAVAQQALERTARLLRPAGLSLKGGSDMGIVDLRSSKEKAELLGFNLHCHDGKLGMTPGSRAWAKLRDALLLAQRRDDPNRAAHAVVYGWINALGPVYARDVSQTIDGLLQEAGQLGFRELRSQQDLEALAGRAYQQWTCLQRQAAADLPRDASFPGGQDRAPSSAPPTPDVRA